MYRPSICTFMHTHSHSRMGGDLGGTGMGGDLGEDWGDGPPKKCEVGTAQVSVPPIFGEVVL